MVPGQRLECCDDNLIFGSQLLVTDGKLKDDLGNEHSMRQQVHGWEEG